MPNIKNFPNNVDEFVGALPLMKFLHGRTSGVFGLQDSAAVTAKQGRMAVQVSDGYGWITDNQKNGCVWWVENKQETGSPAELNIDPADTSLSRIDRVVISWDTTLYANYPELTVIKGRPSGNPAPPALTRNASVWQISLAQVRVPAGTTSITPGLITDERLDPDVCGIVTESARADTSMVAAQFSELLTNFKIKIDQLGQGILPDGSVSSTFTATIPTKGWDSDAHGPFIRVSVSGLLSKDVPYATPVLGEPSDQEAIARFSRGVRRVAAETGSLLIRARQPNKVDVPIFVLCIRK